MSHDVSLDGRVQEAAMSLMIRCDAIRKSLAELVRKIDSAVAIDNQNDEKRIEVREAMRTAKEHARIGNARLAEVHLDHAMHLLAEQERLDLADDAPRQAAKELALAEIQKLEAVADEARNVNDMITNARAGKFGRGGAPVVQEGGRP